MYLGQVHFSALSWLESYIMCRGSPEEENLSQQDEIEATMMQLQCDVLMIQKPRGL
jgi:hypothetical protein